MKFSRSGLVDRLLEVANILSLGRQAVGEQAISTLERQGNTWRGRVARVADGIGISGAGDRVQSRSSSLALGSLSMMGAGITKGFFSYLFKGCAF